MTDRKAISRKVAARDVTTLMSEDHEVFFSALDNPPSRQRPFAPLTGDIGLPSRTERTTRIGSDRLFGDGMGALPSGSLRQRPARTHPRRTSTVMRAEWIFKVRLVVRNSVWMSYQLSAVGLKV